MPTNKTYAFSIRDGAFKTLHAEIVKLQGLHEALRMQKAKVVDTVKAACRKATERDPRMVEALCVIFTEIYGADQVFGITPSGLGLDIKDGSPAKTFWRVVVALLPRVKKVRNNSTTKVTPEKEGLRRYNVLKKTVSPKVLRIIGALCLGN